ncbi:MAG: nucleotidyltransferase domain-containing protein [Promethearchaeota archaeon]
MSELQRILSRKRNREKELKSSLNSMKNQLIRLGALKIILFGSLHHDKIDIHSDIDLLVIMPSSKSGKEWWGFIYDKVERDISSDILVYNQEEFEEDIHHSRFLRNILECGKMIYEKA